MNRKLLSFCAFLLVIGGFPQFNTAWSQQINPTYIQWSGNYRSRFESLHRPAGVSGQKTNRFAHQLILSANFQAQESLKFKASLLGFDTWGKEYAGYAGYPYTEETTPQIIHLYEAFANWGFSSGVSFQMGRFPFEIGNGALFSKNLDDDLPTRFDGGFFQYESDVVKFQLGGFAISDWRSATSNFNDQDYKTYFLNSDLKILQPFFKNISFTFLILDKDEKTLTDLGGIILPKEEKEVYAASLTGETGRVFYSMDGAIQQGENHTTTQSIEANMLHARVGAVAFSPWKLSFYLQGHRDTGDRSDSADKNETYDPLFYNHFQNAGKMNLLGWGNLTYFSLGISWILKRNYNFFLEYNKFYRTSATAGTFGLGPSGGAPIVWDTGSLTDGPYNNSLNSDERYIADEVDFTFEYQAEDGLRFQSITGLFIPGNYLKDYGKDDLVFFQRLGIEFVF